MTLHTLAQTDSLPPPALDAFDPAAIADIDLAAVPILPLLTDGARVIFERGQTLGRNPRMFSKLGDCMTASEHFLLGFGTGDYDLGDNSELQPIVDYINAEPAESNAFTRPNLATEVGFTTISVMDSTWANKEVCEPNESPLGCELRVSNSAFALVMFGTNDVIYFDESTFDYFLRTLIVDTANAGVVPLLYTFPVRPEEPAKTIVFNQLIVKAAQDYDLPLVNLYTALESLPDQGVNLEDTLHLSLPDGINASDFTEDYLQWGYPVRNLLTLQTMQALLTELGEIEPAL
ncbi:MAG: hypothetical protein ACOYL5_19225 [Phototrophicaceae bacterium]